MVVDHLSRLELGEQWDKGYTQEMFPNEKLMRVEATVRSFVDYVNYLACKLLPPYQSSSRRRSSCMMWGVIYGMILYCLRGGLIKSLEDVCLIRKSPTFSTSATLHYMEDISMHKGLLLRYYSLVSFGLHYFVMHMYMWRAVTDARKWAIYLGGMSGHSTTSCRLTSSMFGV